MATKKREPARMIKPLVVIPKDTLDQKTKNRMRHAGYLIVEVPVEQMNQIKVMSPPPLVPLDGLSGLALEVLADKTVGDCSVRDVFKSRLLKMALEQFKGTT